MKKGLIFILAIAFILFLIMNIQSKNNIRVQEEVLKSVSNQEKIRIIVDLEDNQTKNLPGKIRHDFGNKVSLEVNQYELSQIINNRNVKSVDLVGTKKLFLGDSIPLINTTLTWSAQMNNTNLTGQGETICILDTGINYNHSDFGDCYGWNNASSGCKVVGGWDFCADDTSCSTEDSNPFDVHGHGTHVAGIASANGTIKGVAPNSKIIMIKVFNRTGTAWDDDLKKGIEWCVNNASKFNISVISMSLGGGLYNSYCDNTDDPEGITGAINSAVVNNISVIVATGNDGNKTHIASPACIKNATAVASSTKSDSVSSFSNRNSITDLIAPGGDGTISGSINSTKFNSTSCSSGCVCYGNYMVCAGTSMATPHVAGAFALINQFKKLELNKTLTPSQITSALTLEGKQIDDSSGSGLNFSRIDIYSAILYLDEKLPQVSMISPGNNYLNLSSNITLSCNATDELQLSNLTLNVWNSTGNLINQTTQNATSNFLSLELNLTNLVNGTYSWGCLSSDRKGNTYATSNYSVLIGVEIQTTLNSPGNNTFTNLNTANFTCSSETASSSSLRNVTFYLWNSTGSLVNKTAREILGTINETTFNYTFVEEQSYLWNCNSFNNNSNYSFADSNFTVTYDATPPGLNVLSPADSYSVTGTTALALEYNLSGINIANCSLVINNQTDQTNSSLNTSLTNSFSKSLSPGTYYWKINCIDLAGNGINSSERVITINSLSSSSSSSGGSSGGGGGGAVSSPVQTYKIDKQELTSGAKKSIKQGDKIQLEVTGENHIVLLNKIIGNSINLTISSNPINFLLSLGETKKINLNNDKFYDLEITLNSVLSSTADITIKSIHEEIPTRSIFEGVNKTVFENETNLISIEPKSEKKSSGLLLGVLLFGLAMLATIVGKLIFKGLHYKF